MRQIERAMMWDSFGWNCVSSRMNRWESLYSAMEQGAEPVDLKEVNEGFTSALAHKITTENAIEYSEANENAVRRFCSTASDLSEAQKIADRLLVPRMLLNERGE